MFRYIHTGITAIFLLLYSGVLMASGWHGFIPNQGQWKGDFLYKAPIKGGTIFLEPDGITWIFYNSDSLVKMHHNHAYKTQIPIHVVKTRFLNAQKYTHISTEEPEQAHYNFFIGNDPSKWKSKLSSYQKITYHNIYPFIDLEILYNPQGIKYNFIVNPGGKYEDIALKYEGVERIHSGRNGLDIYTSLGIMQEFPPVVFEHTLSGETQTLPAQFVVEDHTVRFSIEKKWKKKHRVVIDPVLIFSTYSGSHADNFGFTATYDSMGNGYSGGTVYNFNFTTDQGFPVTPGAYMYEYNGGVNESLEVNFSYPGRDCAIHKYSANGQTLLYGTFLGGSHNEQPHSMIVNSRHELIVLGSTRSQDFPHTQQYLSNPEKNEADYNLFLVQFSEDGTQLISGALLGGSDNDGINGDLTKQPLSALPLLTNYADDFRGEVILDSQNHIYVATSTHSHDFPHTGNTGGSMVYKGPQSGLVFKLSPNMNELVWSRYVGDFGHDACYGISTGLDNDLFVVGGTNNGTFFNSLNGHKNRMSNSEPDGFLLRLNKNTGAVISGTLIGTEESDQCYMVRCNKDGDPFVFGQTRGAFPVVGDVYHIPNASQFVAKYNRSLNQLLLSSTIGSGSKIPNISPSAFLVDICGNIYISGWGGATNSTHGFRNGNTRNMPITSNAIQAQTDGSDFWIGVFEEDMRSIKFGSYFGGIGNTANRAEEHVDGGTSRFDYRGVIYQSLCAGCGGNSLFPSTRNAFSEENRSQNCNFALFKIDMQMQNRPPIVSDTLIRLQMLDTLDLTYWGWDPDEGDLLSLRFEPKLGDSTPPTNRFIVDTSPQRDSVSGRIIWYTDCLEPGNDTLRIRVTITDQGCPHSDSAQAEILVILTPPPPAPGPEAICMRFQEDGSTLVQWEAFDGGRFFKKAYLHRINPDSTVDLVKIVDHTRFFEITEDPTLDLKGSNYCYFVVTENHCGIVDTLPYRACSMDEYFNPISLVEVIATTVTDDNETQTHWTQSTDDDFRSYIVYKSPNRPNLNWEPVTEIFSINDTFFIDKSVDVDKESFCYCVQATDLCGNISDTSNLGCNIVLSGISKRWYFDLEWQPYRQWDNGVEGYDLLRSVDTGLLRSTAYFTDKRLSYRDEQLDYDWGGYYYRVKATQYPQDNKHQGISYSNRIYLFQPPLLHVPNVFSPNGDNLNDEWGFVPVFVREFRMRVYNRWGEKVFDSEDKKKQWNGDFMGNEPFDNVFIWVATYKGWDDLFYQQKGTVTIVR